MYQRESHICVHQCQALEFMQYMAVFHRVFFKKAATSHKIEKQVLDHNIGARRTYTRLLTLEFGALDDDACTHAVAGALGAHFDLADGHNTGQCLASKTHGMEREQIISMSDLGCCMAFESHTRIYRRHSAAIVHHLY